MERLKDLSSPFSLLIVLISFSLHLLGATAQDFPHKPIVLYCGQEAGATTDLTSRALAKGAEKELRVPVGVENKPFVFPGNICPPAEFNVRQLNGV